MNIFYGDPSFERLLSAIASKVPDRVPVLEFWPMSGRIFEFVLERPLGYAIGSAMEGRTDSVRIEDLLEFSLRVGMDAVGADFVWWPGQVFEKSADGACHYVDGRIKERGDIARMERPEDLDVQCERYREYGARAKGSGVGVFPRVSAFFNPAYLAVGLIDFWYKVHDDLGFIELLMDALFERQMRVMETVCSLHGVRFIQIDDDIAYGAGLFLRPDLFRRLYFERMKSFLKPAKERGILIVYHTDGKLDDALPILLELGVNAVHPVEPMCNDIYAIKRRYAGKMCLCGNIDLRLLSQGSPGEVREDVKAHLDVLKTGGGYVCGSSSSLYDGVSPVNYCELVKAVHDFGFY